MSIYAIGDLHLSFDDIVEKPMDIFGQSWINHTDNLSRKWIETVSEEDTIIIAGDVSWGLKMSEATADFQWIHCLPGKKIVIKGNHDLWWTSVNKLNRIHEDMVFLQNHCYILEDGVTAICGTRGWICPGTDGFTDHDNKIYERELIRLKMSLDEAKKWEHRKLYAHCTSHRLTIKCSSRALRKCYVSTESRFVFMGICMEKKHLKMGYKEISTELSIDWFP